MKKTIAVLIFFSLTFFLQASIVESYEMSVGGTMAGRENEALYLTLRNVDQLLNAVGACQFQIESNTSWTVSADKEWVEIETLLGTGNYPITIYLTSNYTGSIREATITITGVGVSTQTIPLTQLPTPDLLKLSKNMITVGAGASTTEDVFLDNYDQILSWTAVVDQSWLTISSTSGTGDATIYFNVTENNSSTSRVAIVSITSSVLRLSETETITVTQDAGTGSSVPEDYVLSDSTVQIGEMPCFNASDTITVAGDGSLVEFYDDSSVELIAGSTIRFLPGFHAYEGSFAHAWITTDGSFCDGSSGTIVENPQPEKSGDAGIILPTGDGEEGGMELKVYPNPNKGKFIIELAKVETKAEVKVYNALGGLVYRAEVQDGQSTIDLSGTRRGLYFVKVTEGKEQFTRKMVVN